MAIKINPNNAVYFKGLGISYRESKRYNDAIEQFNKGIKINDKFIDLYILKAEILKNENNHTVAKQVFEAALDKDQKNLTILEKLGFLYFRLESYEEAIKISEKGLSIFSS